MPARKSRWLRRIALGCCMQYLACSGIGSPEGTGTTGTTTAGTTTSDTTTAGTTTASSTTGTTTAGTTAGTTTAGATTAGATTAGTTTAGTTTAGTTTGSTTGGNVSLLTSLDFEDGSLGDWALLDFNDDPLAGSGYGTGSGITTAQAAHGTHSLMVVAGGDYDDAVWLTNTALFPITPNALYVRFYINLTSALPADHTTFALVDGTGGGAGGNTLTEVRMGGQYSYLVGNLELNDAQVRSGGNSGDPTTQPGVPLTPGTWYCMELLFDGVGNTMRTWLNNSEITDLAVLMPSDWSSTPSTADWMPDMAHLKLGWQAYGGDPNQTLYLDDVAVAQGRIGCL